MAEKHGIFDPWRQQQPKPEKVKNPDDLRVVATDLDDAPPVASPIRVHGSRAGINIWRVWREEAQELREVEAHQHLVSVIRKLIADTAVRALFTSYNVSFDNTLRGHEIDGLVFALRAIQNRFPGAAKTLASEGIRPYVT